MAKRGSVSDGSYTSGGFVQGAHNDSEWEKSNSNGCAGVIATVVVLLLAVAAGWYLITTLPAL